jgi:hypothetical protein
METRNEAGYTFVRASNIDNNEGETRVAGHTSNEMEHRRILAGIYTLFPSVRDGGVGRSWVQSAEPNKGQIANFLMNRREL